MLFMFKLPHTLLTLLALAPVLAGQDGESTTPQSDKDEAEVELTNIDVQEAEYFKTCDYDENGWISYREAESSLHMNRDGFAQYDADNNGQVSQQEFNDRYRELLVRVGTFRTPTPKGVALVPAGSVAVTLEPASTLPSTSQAFVGLYDKDADGKLNVAELELASQALGFAGLSPSAVLGKLDIDKSGTVEPAELQTVLDALNVLDAASLIPLGTKASSIEELFGGNEPRPYFTGATPRPPRIGGPVVPFRRLDLDNSGFIDIADLEQLSLSAHTVVRPSAVLAGLDLNGDGRLSPEEMKAAFNG